MLGAGVFRKTLRKSFGNHFLEFEIKEFDINLLKLKQNNTGYLLSWNEARKMKLVGI